MIAQYSSMNDLPESYVGLVLRLGVEGITLHCWNMRAKEPFTDAHSNRLSPFVIEHVFDIPMISNIILSNFTGAEAVIEPESSCTTVWIRIVLQPLLVDDDQPHDNHLEVVMTSMFLSMRAFIDLYAFTNGYLYRILISDTSMNLPIQPNYR